MKIGIIYGTERKAATVKIVEWLKTTLEQKKITVEIGLPHDFQTYDCDGYILGSAVYQFSVWPEFLTFLDSHGDRFRDKPFALFVVCGITFLANRHMNNMIKRLPSQPVTKIAFKGQRNINAKLDKQQPKAAEWAAEIENLFKKAKKI